MNNQQKNYESKSTPELRNVIPFRFESIVKPAIDDAQRSIEAEKPGTGALASVHSIQRMQFARSYEGAVARQRSESAEIAPPIPSVSVEPMEATELAQTDAIDLETARKRVEESLQ